MSLKTVFAVAVAFLSCVCSSSQAAEDLKDVNVVFKTSKGDIAVVVYASKVPVTAANFLNLAKREYYSGLTFHRVIPNFMVQGGDPQGTGSGGPGYKFQDETIRELTHEGPGVLSMANSDNPRLKRPFSNTGKTNGSQFFITHVKTDWLDGMHTVFGKVTKGQDVVNKIRKGDKIKSIEIADEKAAAALFKSQASQIKEWNKVLDRNKKR